MYRFCINQFYFYLNNCHCSTYEFTLYTVLQKKVLMLMIANYQLLKRLASGGYGGWSYKLAIETSCNSVKEVKELYGKLASPDFRKALVVLKIDLKDNYCDSKLHDTFFFVGCDFFSNTNIIYIPLLPLNTAFS